MAYKINTVFTATYDSLKSTINGVKSQFKSVEKSAESAKNSVSNTFNSVNKDIQEANKSIKESSELINTGLKASAIGIATLTVPTILAGKSALTMAGQYEAATQTLEYTLGEAKAIVDDFVQNNAQAIGMAEQDAYKFANIYSNLLTTMTNDQTTNAEYTNKLMQASAVIMSKTGRTFTDVADRIRSGLLGNTEAIEDLGVNVNVALLETTDAFKQIANGRGWDNLSFQEQQQIRLLGILEQTTKKYGEQVGDNLSLKLSRTSATFQNIKTEASNFFATGLQPMLAGINNVISGILVFVKWLNTLSDGTKQAITTFIVIIAIIPVVALVFLTLIKAINSYVIFTKVASTSTVTLAKTMLTLLGTILLLVAGIAMLAYAFGAFDNTSKNIKKTTNGIGSADKWLQNLTNTQNENAESAEKASKANKELADNLQGFDEINKLNLDSDASNSGLDSSIGPTVDLSGIDTSPFDNIGTEFGNLNEKVEAFKNRMEELKPVIGAIGAVLTGLGILNLLGGVTGLINKLGTLGQWISKIGTFIMQYAKQLGGVALIIASLKTGFDSIKKLIDGDLTGSFMDFLKTVGLVIAGVTLLFGIVPALIVGLVVAIGYLITILVTKWEAFCVGCQYLWETACNAICDFFQGIADWFAQKWLEFKTGWKVVCENVATFFKNTWQNIQNFFGGIWQWICDKAYNIGSTFYNVWENIKNGFINVWNTIKSFTSNIGTTVANAVGGTIQGVVNSVIGFAENTINGFIRAINGAIGLINAIPGVNIGYLTELSIPRVNWYANGGVFGSKSIIGVGEYAGARSNPEIVAPQSMIYDASIEAIKDSNKGGATVNNSSDSITKKVEVELNLKSGGVKLGKQIVDLVLDANDFYDLGLI